MPSFQGESNSISEVIMSKDRVVLIHHNRFSSDEFYASEDGRYTVKRERNIPDQPKQWVFRDKLKFLETDFDMYRNDLFERNNLVVEE